MKSSAQPPEAINSTELLLIQHTDTYTYTHLRHLKQVLSIYNTALHANQYCKPRVGEDEILERVFYCDEALGETVQRGCGCFILASVQGQAGCGFE